MIHNGFEDSCANCKSGLPVTAIIIAPFRIYGRTAVSAAGGDHKEEVLLAAARAVLAAMRGLIERRELPPYAIASLQLLEIALEDYAGPAR